MVDSSAWPAIPNLGGEDEEERSLLREMGEEALAYVGAFAWAPPVRRASLAFGVGGVITLFLVDFTNPVDGADDQLWVIVGDLPSAYFVTDQAADAASASEVYCNLMEDWVDAVFSGSDVAYVYPVDAAPTVGNAAELRRRLGFIRDSVVPTIKG